MKWFSLLVVSFVLALSGCASSMQEQYRDLPLAIPLQPSVQQEVQIARFSQLLTKKDLTNEQRAELHFQRGMYYDSLGMRELARYDFNQSLSINPAQPDVFNLLGVYFTQIAQYDAAYEAFDSTLELDPSNQYAERNRAIALYYGDRVDLALEEITKHYEDEPEDPFRALWLYIIEVENIDKKIAYQNLQQRYENRDEKWSWDLVALILDEGSEEETFKHLASGAQDNVELAQRFTEAYFYLAKRHQIEGNYAEAISLYKLALSLNVYEYVEHRYAFLELSKMYTELREHSQE